MRGGVSGVSQPSFGLFRLTCAPAAACRRNPIHNYLQLPRTGRPACHDRIGSDEQTSHNNSTHSVMIRDAIPRFPHSNQRRNISENRVKCWRASVPVPPTFLIFFFSSYFSVWLFELPIWKSRRGGGRNILTLFCHYYNCEINSKSTTKKFERNVRKEWCVRW